MRDITCPRCGNHISHTFKEVKKVIKCPHCNMELMIDGRSQRMLKYTRTLFVAIVVSILMIGMMNLGTVSSYVALIIVLSIMLALMNVYDRLCLIITDKIFHLRYVPFEKPDVKEAIKARKAKEKKKHGL